MSRKTLSIAFANNVRLPVDAYWDLKAFRDELMGIAHTIDPAAQSPYPFASMNNRVAARWPARFVYGPG